MEKQNNKLVGKDLINVGIYSAMTLVVFFIFGLLTTIPVVYPILLFVLPFVCGIPMMLYYTKIQKFGMRSILFLYRVYMDRDCFLDFRRAGIRHCAADWKI